jgi:hypothetical protein
MIKKSLDQGCREINKISYVIWFIRLVCLNEFRGRLAH